MTLIHEYLKQIGKRGGRSRSERKRAAVRANLEKARLVRVIHQIEDGIESGKFHPTPTASRTPTPFSAEEREIIWRRSLRTRAQEAQKEKK